MDVSTEAAIQGVFTPRSPLRKSQVIHPSSEYIRPARLTDTVPPPMVFSGPHSKANDPALTQRLPILRSDPVGGEVDRSVHGQPCPDWNATSKGDDASAASDPFQIPQAEMLAHKPCRQKLKQVARDNSAAECTDTGPGVEGARRYTCPVEGCDKTYKQANGLKYHLT